MQETEQTFIERRKYPRLNKLLPVGLVLQDLQAKSKLSCEAVGRDVSQGGVFIEIADPDALSVNLQPRKNLVNLDINLTEVNVRIKAVADVVWTKKIKTFENRLGLGLQFSEVTEENRLNSYISEFLREQEEKVTISDIVEKKLPAKPDLDGLPKFTLLIDGKDVDTGVYRYYPIAEKVIIDPRKTLEAISQVKKKENTTSDYKDYIFAKYCVGYGDVNRKAIQSAYKAFRDFSKFDLERRKKIIEDILDLIVVNRKILIELLVTEGHTRNLAEWQLWGMERVFNRKSINFYKTEMWKDLSEGNEAIYLARRPDGVVCLSPPQNAPATNSTLAIMTFLAGNTLIVKPPLRNPISTIFLWRNVVYEALKRNGAPEGTLNIVLGNSKRIMSEWLDSPLVNDIIFFGESNKGLDIACRAYAKGKKAILELTGNDMLFVWKDAPIDEAVNAFLDCFLGSTQICMVPKKAIIHEDIYDEFVNLFLAKVKELKIGLPADYTTGLIPVVKIDELFTFLNDALKKGAKLIYGGERLNHRGEIDENGIFVRPAVVLVDDQKVKDMLCIKEENYFPLIPLVKINAQYKAINNRDETIFRRMVELANSNQYGLRISVWVRSDIYLRKFMEEMSNSGILRINSRHVGFSTYLSSHGGPGRTGGPYGEMNYIWMRTSHLQGISKVDIENYEK